MITLDKANFAAKAKKESEWLSTDKYTELAQWGIDNEIGVNDLIDGLKGSDKHPSYEGKKVWMGTLREAYVELS